MEELNMPLVEEILLAAAQIEIESGHVIDYIGLSYDAYLKIKNDLEESLDRPVTAAEIQKSLTMKHVILPGLGMLDYKFLREVRFDG